MRRKIFTRILALIALLIACSSTILSALEIGVHRRLQRRNADQTVQILAHEIEPWLLWNDRVAIRKALVRVVESHVDLRYAFVEAEGKVVAHSFVTGVPVGLLGRLSAEAAGPPRALRDEDGRVFYDLSIPVASARAVVHVGLDRSQVCTSEA